MCNAKTTTMKVISVITLFSTLIISNLFGQHNDSSEVKHITYKPNSSNGEMVLVSEQQLKAKPFYDEGYLLVGNYEFKKAIVGY